MLTVNAAGVGKPSDSSIPIWAKPMKEPPKLHLDGLLGRRIKVRAGEPIHIDIQLSGAPIPTIAWAKEDKSLPLSNRISSETTSSKTKLHIASSVREDSGKYTVSAVNDFGSDKADFEVIVVDRPGQPSNFKPSKISGEAITLTWNEPEDNGGAEINGQLTLHESP